MSSKKILRIFSGIMAALMLMSSSALAAPEPGEQLPQKETDKVFLSTYSLPVEGEDYVYKVMVQAQANYVEFNPPSIITFLLDGTDSMHVDDSTGISRDAKVRQAVVEAFKVLMSDQNANQENTFVNIIIFGSTADKAVSLTRWASSSGLMTTLKYGDHVASGGSRSDYVPLLAPGNSGKINPLLAQLFYCDYDSLALKPEGLPGTLDPSYPISNVYFFGNSLAPRNDGDGGGTRYTSRFPISSTGTFVNGGMRLAYEALLDKFTEVQSDPKYTQWDIENSSRYIMLLCDGDDGSSAGTQSYAAAIKAPASISINSAQYSGGGTVPGSTPPTAIPLSSPTSFPALQGLDGHIWSMVIGGAGVTAAEAGWKSNYLSNGLVFSPFARNMISIAAEPVANWTGLAGRNNVNPPSSPNTWQDYYGVYQSDLDSGNFSSQTHYLRTNDASDATNYFSDFAAAAVLGGGAKNTIGTGAISADFNLFNYRDPKYAPHTFSSISGHQPEIIMKSDGRFTWDIGNLEPNETVTLVYYIQLKPEFWNDGLWHDTSASLYISYDGMEGGSYRVNFPKSYVPPASPSSSKSSNKGFNDYEEESAVNSGTLSVNPLPGENGLSSPLSGISLARHQSSDKKVAALEDKTPIFQKTTAGKYKAKALAKKGTSFTVLAEEGDYYKILFVKKGADKASSGYIKKTDVAIVELQEQSAYTSLR